MALVEHGDSSPSSILSCVLGYALWSYLYHIPLIYRGLHDFKSIFTKKFPEKNFHSERLHMNERIRELAKQTGYIWHASGEPQIYEFTPEKLEKFAELILQDAMSICESLGDKGMDGHYCVDKIRKEFGL
jgi:hypothetical protein